MKQNAGCRHLFALKMLLQVVISFPLTFYDGNLWPFFVCLMSFDASIRELFFFSCVFQIHLFIRVLAGMGENFADIQVETGNLMSLNWKIE